jgi:hypothetical protein
MHTVISSFSKPAEAERAMERLAQEGFPRDRMHLQHRELPQQGITAERWDVMEREVAVDRSALEAIGHFFVSLFGKDHPEGHAQRYSEAVGRGECVLVLDAVDAQQAERAADLLVELGGQDRQVVPRSEGANDPRWTGGTSTAEREGRVISEPMAGRLDAGGQIDRSDPAEHNHVIAGAQRELRPVMDPADSARAQQERADEERAFASDAGVARQRDGAADAAKPSDPTESPGKPGRER